MKFFSFLIFLSLIFVANAYAALPSVPVYQFNVKNKAWDSYVVPSIGEIEQIITAGKYAWAINNTNYTIAFFNGAQWGQATTIDGFEGELQFYPGYPISGEEPIAWAIDKNYNKPAIVFFDGSTWTKPLALFEREVSSFMLQVSSGHAWIVYEYKENPHHVHIKVADKRNPLHWTNLPDIAIQFDEFEKPYSMNFDRIRSLNDEYPCLFVSDDTNLFLIKPNGNWKIIKNRTLKSSIDLKNHHLLVDSEDGLQFSSDNGNVWINITNPKLYTAYNYTSLYEGMFCDIRNVLDFSCINTSSMDLRWKEFTIPHSEYLYSYGFMEVSDKFGVWVEVFLPENYKEILYIYRYDFETGKLTNTQITPLVSHDYDYDKFPWDRTSISDKEYLGCGPDINHRFSAFYYDGNKWFSYLLPNISDGVFSGESLGRQMWYGQQVSSRHVPNGNVWIYPRISRDKYQSSKKNRLSILQPSFNEITV